MVKQTGELAVLGGHALDEKTINIHPNDGYDIGLMTSSHVVEMYAGCTPEELRAGSADTAADTLGTINLKNECRIGTVEMSAKMADKLGASRKARLVLSDGGDGHAQLFIQGV